MDIKADTETIEKVSKALARSFNIDPNMLSGIPLGEGDWEPCQMWEHYIPQAKAAIEAIMEKERCQTGIERLLPEPQG